MLGRPATQAEIGAFAAGQPAIFGAIQAGAGAFASANADNPAVNPLLGLQSLQFLPPFLNYPNAVEDGKTSDNDFSWSLRGNYEVTDNINVYLNYATGFKASSFNVSIDSRPTAANFIPGSPVTNPPSSPIRDAGLAIPNLVTGSRFAGPEDSEVYEAGIKAAWRHAQFNLTIFEQNIKGFQSNVFTGDGFFLSNAGKQSTFGIEFDGSVQPIKGLNLFAAFTYLNPQYDSFTLSPYGDISGTSPAGIPDLSASFGFDYTYEFDSGTRLMFHTDLLLESPTQLVDGFPALCENPPTSCENGLAAGRLYERQVDQLNASITLKLVNGFEVSAWGRNLTNDKYLITAFDAVAQPGSISTYPSQPITYGGTLRYRF